MIKQFYSIREIKNFAKLLHHVSLIFVNNIGQSNEIKIQQVTMPAATS